MAYGSEVDLVPTFSGELAAAIELHLAYQPSGPFGSGLGLSASGSLCLLATPREFTQTSGADMEADIPWQNPVDKELILTLLDDARMLLGGGKYNHENPQGAYGHARAIAKADAALGYAKAADLFHRELLSQ